ncbi:MAG: FimV/HubP family polar landmark protein [Cardiobacteriaceae bacterium]|nr:FimV/HubP family polar landmark protein [Cardiobacteriaceae bacterium]
MNGHQPSNRLKYAVILALGFGVSQFADAVGLGPIIGVNSHLGQPLSANIRVDGLSKEQAQRASVTLASAEEYRSRGIQRLPSHDQLRFKIVPAGNGYRIHVSSKSGIREPFINFLLTINSGGEKITREYALFLNPDPAGGITPAAPALPEPVEAPQAVVDAAPKTAPVPVPVAQPTPAMPQPVASNDNGFIGEARPSQGIIPANPEAEGWGVVSPNAQRVALSTQQQSASAPPAASGGAGGTYGPVKRGETLYSIAAATKPASMSVNDMMVAIKRANPHAFNSSSMNSLKAGVTLTIPNGSGAAQAPAAQTQVAAAETPAEKPRNRRNRRGQQNAQQQAPAPQTVTETAAAAQTPAAEMPTPATEEGNVPMAMTAETAASTDIPATEMPQGEMSQGEIPAEPVNPEGMTAAQTPPGMDTTLSLEGVDSIADGNMPTPDMPATEMPQGDMAGSEAPMSEMPPAETVADAAPVQTAPPVVETPPAQVQTPVAQPAPAAASQSDSPLPFGLQLWHLAVAGGALLLGLLLAILMKARGRKRDIDDIEDMSPAEIDRMVAELENDASLQKSFHDDIDNLDDLSYEQLSREKASLEGDADDEEALMKARLAELAALEALEEEAAEEDDFDTLAQQAERLPAFAPDHDDAATTLNVFDDLDVEESAEEIELTAAEEASADSFDWDFSQEEPTVQTSAHEENADDFFSVDEPWAAQAPAAAAPQAAAVAEDRFEFDVEPAQPAAKAAPQLRIVPVESASAVAEPSPEKVEAMEINLDLATSFIATGNAQRARLWLDEVMLEGSAAQKALAAQLLKKIDAQK